jgi:hypothetical protein
MAEVTRAAVDAYEEEAETDVLDPKAQDDVDNLAVQAAFSILSIFEPRQ